jgi:hypothetical protein
MSRDRQRLHDYLQHILETIKRIEPRIIAENINLLAKLNPTA